MQPGATLLSGPDDLPASQERGRSLEAARLAVPPRGEGRGRKDARSGWGGAWHDPRLASRMEGWHTMRPNTLRLARRGAGRAATPPGALWLEVCPPRPSIPATRRDVGGWWVSPRVSSLPGGALVAAERDRLNGTCCGASFCRFDPGDERQRSSLSSQEMSYCPQRCPKIPRQELLPPTPLEVERAPRPGQKGREMRPGWRSTRNSKLGRRESPRRWTWAARRQPCAGRSIERQRGGFESKRNSQHLRHFIGLPRPRPEPLHDTLSA